MFATSLMLFAEPSEFIFTAGYQSPVSHLDLAMSERGLVGLSFGGPARAPYQAQTSAGKGAKEDPRLAPQNARRGTWGTRIAKGEIRWIEAPERFTGVFRQLDEYFAGTRRQFDLPLDLRGPDFHQRCWQALLRIPYGETWSYAQLAAAVGSPRASRAVGQANHHNPVAIIVPCHRVIASNGSLAGFGGGVEIKEFLLRLEGAIGRRDLPQQGSLFGEWAV